jgi:NADH-quinone oxidoreductase subunit E
MLTDLEKEEILEEIKLYPKPSSACIDALKIVQSHRGWISDEAVRDIAVFLEMSPEEVDGVATFYSRIYRKPVGRNVILLCDSISCMIMENGALLDYLTAKLAIAFGETTPDRRFTMLPISCLGDCDHAPAMMINNDHYNMISTNKLDEILERYK